MILYKKIKKQERSEKMNEKKVFRMYKTKGSEKLLPIYNKLQKELNLILSNKFYKEELMKIDLKYIDKEGKERSKLGGTLQKEIVEIIGKRLVGEVNSWYVRILLHNIISLLKSRKEQVEIHKLLKENAYKIDSELKKRLKEKKLSASKPYLERLAAKSIPTLPDKKVFILDFSTSDKQMFRIGKNGRSWEVKIYSKEEKEKYNLESRWIEIETYLPIYIREGFKGEAAKPQFYMDKGEDRFVCAIPCKIETIPNEYKNIMGVDIGKIKPYSATVIRKDGSISDEYIPTEELMKMRDKLDRLETHVKSVYKKHSRSKKYRNFTKRQKMRKIDYKNGRKKRTNLKYQIARLIAVEVVNVAIQEECKEIHIEYLNWLKNKAGKWNFSAIQKCIEEVAELYNIKVVKVNAKNSSKENPVTGEIGKVNDREVKFTTGEVIDRDQLAGLNLALRRPKEEPRKIKQLKKRKEQTTTRLSRQSNFKRIKNTAIPDKKINKRENVKIVMFSHDKATNSYAIVNVFCVSQNNCYKDNNIHFIHIYDNFTQ